MLDLQCGHVSGRCGLYCVHCLCDRNFLDDHRCRDIVDLYRVFGGHLRCGVGFIGVHKLLAWPVCRWKRFVAVQRLPRGHLHGLEWGYVVFWLHRGDISVEHRSFELCWLRCR